MILIKSKHFDLITIKTIKTTNLKNLKDKMFSVNKYILFFVILKYAYSQTRKDQNLDTEWQKFKKDYNKIYENESIESYRYLISLYPMIFQFNFQDDQFGKVI